MKTEIEKIMGNDLSHLNTLDLEELNSFKNLAIEQSVDPTLNEFQKASLIWVANYIESLMVQRSGIYWLSNNFTLPTESANIVYTIPKKPKKEPESKIKIDDWSELLIKVHAYKIEFQKKGSSTSQPFTLTDIGWYGLKLEIIKEFHDGYCIKRNDQVTSRVSELNKQLCDMFGLEQYPFIYDRRKKYRTSLIDIEIYDANERLLDATLKLDRNVFNKSRSGLTYANHDDGYQHDAMQNYLSLSDIDEDDDTY
jgi:hypothetical protein